MRKHGPGDPCGKVWRGDPHHVVEALVNITTKPCHLRRAYARLFVCLTRGRATLLINSNMFSPESTLLGAQQASTHNPRRRQRHGSESFKQEQAPRRKRSRLSSETFMPPSSDGVQPDADLDANGHLRPATNGGSKLLQLQGMPVREKKQSHKGARSQKGDRGSILVFQTLFFGMI